MAHGWIDSGLRQMRQLEEERRLAAERRLHHAAVIRDRGPALMRRLVAEVGKAVAEYKAQAPHGGTEIELEELPGEGFCVMRSNLPKVTLECRPGYETHLVYCNLARVEDHDSAPVELVFSLRMSVGPGDAVDLSNETTVFQSLDDTVEFLLKPVLFPTLIQDQDATPTLGA